MLSLLVGSRNRQDLPGRTLSREAQLLRYYIKQLFIYSIIYYIFNVIYIFAKVVYFHGTIKTHNILLRFVMLSRPKLILFKKIVIKNTSQREVDSY